MSQHTAWQHAPQACRCATNKPPVCAIVHCGSNSPFWSASHVQVCSPNQCTVAPAAAAHTGLLKNKLKPLQRQLAPR